MNDEQAVHEVFLRDLAGGKFETVQMQSCMFGLIRHHCDIPAGSKQI